MKPNLNSLILERKLCFTYKINIQAIEMTRYTYTMGHCGTIKPLKPLFYEDLRKVHKTFEQEHIGSYKHTHQNAGFIMTKQENCIHA